jgi:hypothetical protein
MKKFFLIIFTICNVNAYSQTYPFFDNFESYTSLTTLGTQGGYTSNMDIYPYGIGSSKALVAQMFSFGSATRTTTTPLVGPFTATTQVSFSYKIMAQNAPIPSSYTMTLGDSLNIYVNVGPSSFLIGTINSSNQTPSSSFQNLVIPSDPQAAGFSSTFKIAVIRATGNEFYVDMDSLLIGDAGGVSGISVTTEVTNVSCYGNCNGVIQTNTTGGIPPYSFVWNTGDFDEGLVELCPGTYTLTVTDSNGDTYVSTTTITQPDSLIATVSVVDASSAGATDGSIAFSAQGGTLPYYFSIDYGVNYSQNSAFNNLAVDCYYPIVRDENNCIAGFDSVCISFSNNVSNIEIDNFNVYPNPANTFIQLTLNNNSRIEIYNSIGQMVIAKKILFINQRIDISMLTIGTYYIRVKNDKNTIVKYFTVNR